MRESEFVKPRRPNDRNMPTQHCWAQHVACVWPPCCDMLGVVGSNLTIFKLKPRPNDHNMPTQHIATLLGATCCVRLATLLRHVGCCWLKFDHFPNLSQQHPTRCNTSQHGGQTHAPCYAQQCWDMLCWHVAIVWPGL